MIKVLKKQMKRGLTWARHIHVEWETRGWQRNVTCVWSRKKIKRSRSAGNITFGGEAARKVGRQQKKNETNYNQKVVITIYS